MRKKEHYFYKTYYPSGGLKSSYYLLGGKLNGEKNEYYESGDKSFTCTFKNDQREGICLNYKKDREIDYLNFYVNDKPVYGRFYSEKFGEIFFEEIFSPIVEVNDSTLNETNEISFNVIMPIPDSLITKEAFSFMYDLKPLSLKDSVLFTPKYEVLIYPNESFYGTISNEEIQDSSSLIFYGYIAEKDQNGKIHAFNPFEKELNLD